ncbi:MAG: putative hydrolase of the alpha/beta-hydrolase fold [Idiomarinaceae bacterium HL-53]|nr:MAG: putative hydrolase of the alpha/beta-hydrolase fold [Idiomarinaceae bacterium HL-53]CUS49294.1 hypothetical protein Ga0003345_2282 [Idiomarinaceae bacterium HL-53]
MQAQLQWLASPEFTNRVILFAHGAGAGPESEFMQTFAKGLAKRSQLAMLTFPYWQQVQATGKKRPPDSAKILDAAMLAAGAQIRAKLPTASLVVIGKSMGARVAFRCAEPLRARARVALGFPFHPPSKPEKNRLGELKNGSIPTLIVQGTRDPFGNHDYIEQASQSNECLRNSEFLYVAQGNHDLKQPKRIAEKLEQPWQQIIGNIEQWLENK